MKDPENPNSFPLDEIKAGRHFSQPVYLDENFILAVPEMPVSADLIRILKNWEYEEIYSAGEILEEYAHDNDSEINKAKVLETTFRMDSEKMRQAEKFIAEFQKYVEILFDNVDIKYKTTFQLVAEKIKSICDTVRENKRFILRVLRDFQPIDNYLASHSVKTSIISIVIGYYIKLPVHRIIELGTAGLLHDIGMLKLPSELYLSEKVLEMQERKVIMTHPVVGFNLLKNLDFPLSISLVALEHHERENGTGYPRQITSEKISLYSKIVSVACSYSALSSKRTYKETKDGYTGMLEMLRNEGKQYDETIVRTLVFSLSIYPIGLYVLLSSGKHGQVVDVNPDNPRYPIVKILEVEIETEDKKNKFVETTPHGLYIVRPLNREELNLEKNE